MKDNTYRLFDAIENPDHFSDEEIRDILADSDNREIYKYICKTADILTSMDDPDIDREWEQFEKRYNKSALPGFINSFRNFFHRNAAAVLLCILASLAVVGATIGVSHVFSYPRESSVAKQNTVVVSAGLTTGVSSANDSVMHGNSTAEESRIVIFKDEPFGQMITAIADFYGVTVEYKNDMPKELRMYFYWDCTRPLNEIVEQLNNFEQIKIRITDSTICVE